VDCKTQALKSRCIRALKRIFILCDRDRDSALSDAELNDLQVSFASMFATSVLNLVLSPSMTFLTIQEWCSNTC
jgi:Ca2+-binding EF-hand superfamily protein